MEESSNSAQIVTKRPAAIRVIKYALFSASIIPALVGAALAYFMVPGKFSLQFALIAGIGLFIGQMAGDYLYYYGTHFHSDQRDAHTKIFAGWKPLYTDTFLGDKGTLYAGIFCLVIDLGIAVFFTIQLGYEVLLLAALGALVAIFFTPLMLKGYKEPVIFFTFGPLVMLGVYFVIVHDFSWIPILVSLPLGFLVTVVAYLKGAKFELSQSGENTMVLKLNRQVILILSVLAYLSLAVIILLELIPVTGWWSMLAIPVSYSVLSVVQKGSSEVSAYLWAVVRAILALVIVGLILTIVLCYG